MDLVTKPAYGSSDEACSAPLWPPSLVVGPCSRHAALASTHVQQHALTLTLTLTLTLILTRTRTRASLSTCRRCARVEASEVDTVCLERRQQSAACDAAVGLRLETAEPAL